MLYLVSTPIGHLSDITLRALEILKKCDYILCEDTRRSKILLEKHQIEARLKSFHKFNEKTLEDQVIEDLRKGLSIAVISDAGTPLIADPGENLVARCHQESLPFTVVPGACSVIAALSLSGFAAIPFQFYGFLPKKLGALKTIFEKTSAFEGTTIFFESPQRLLKTLDLLKKSLIEARVCVVREITKIFEECKVGSAAELHAYYEKKPPKGEIVLLIEKSHSKPVALSEEEVVQSILKLAKEKKIALKEAIKAFAKTHPIDKKAFYKKLCHKNT